ncbi:hypothetical protein [uncultured Tenacibaculum sp.]|uniref:hypothetical protein n=1 Tax=uncultured Tenacibaculum sp. TaxID=174713 RepID=UPI00262B3915|nr:hypothetical protein [uncultured Tenacibaculum sp.]
MKKLIQQTLSALALVFFLFSCSEAEDQTPETLTIENKIEILEDGNWLLKGFEDRVMYAFKEGKRETFYGENGEFSQPIPATNDYFPTGTKLTIDLNFGNIKTYDVQLSCNNNIVELYDENGTLNSTLYKQNSDYENCLN